MQCQDQPAVAFPQISHTAPADFRVVARFADRSQALLSMAQTCAQAICLAKRFVGVVVRDRRDVHTRRTNNRKPICQRDRTGLRKRREKRICAVHVEQWVGSTIEGRWRRLDSEDGGFDHFFGPHKKEEGDPSSLRSGDVVECVLLAERTRKGGWMARLCRRMLAGPITNTAEVPESASPGEAVELRIGAISAKRDRVQFHWPVSHNDRKNGARGRKG